MICREVNKGKYANSDVYVEFEVLSKRAQLLLTDQRLLSCVRNDMFGGWQSEWTHRWSECAHVRPVERGIELLLAEKSRKVLGLFASSEQQRKLIPMAENARRAQLIEAMQKLLPSAGTASH